jgi:23S rRNA (cytidine1920-2'-O)/16S rRNA (cytidine1409-2'-O)-methyltransferase
VGQSTGGFTDALLQRGAARVVGIDVGRAQLAAALAADARVVSFEGLNARDVAGSEFAQTEAEHSFVIVVADLSFITLTHVLPTVAAYLAPGGHALMLVKPQFELQPADIGKGGLVKHASAYPRVETRIRDACKALQLQVRDYFDSTVVGGDGNREFFVWATAPAA